nr:hypothetical protein [uncultured Desulfobacter sp.]
MRTAPFPILRLFNHFRPGRIQDNISAQLQQMGLFLNQYSFVPALEGMPTRFCG